MKNQIKKIFDDMCPYKLDHSYDCVDAIRYCVADIENTQNMIKEISKNQITNVIFNNPATIVFWGDGSKTVVKCDDTDAFDPEKGLAMAIAKHFLGTNKSKGNYYNVFEEWVPKKEEVIEREPIGYVTDKIVAEDGDSITLQVKIPSPSRDYIKRILDDLGVEEAKPNATDNSGN